MAFAGCDIGGEGVYGLGGGGEGENGVAGVGFGGDGVVEPMQTGLHEAQLTVQPFGQNLGQTCTKL